MSGDLNPVVVERPIDPEMLRRCAEACHNLQKQTVGRIEWFKWVPEHLEQVAAVLDSAREVERVSTDGAEPPRVWEEAS